jgi:hypothetical protein
VGVEAVLLPEVPDLGVRLLGVTEAEALDLQALGCRIDDDLAPVVRELGEEVAERLAELRRREREGVLTLVVGVERLDRGPAGLQPAIEEAQPPQGRASYP